MTHRPAHPSLMSLPQLEATWGVRGETPLPECAYDPELHTGPRLAIETADERAAREAVAREICQGCPARLLCAAYALKVRPSAGVWAGRSAGEITADAVEFDALTASTRAGVA
ncbi:WhiB family transcriptional regulator [Microbispora sp. NPDC049633]|uniref:WhiB family transcriptional regulator n=1 Tax=Microbispora sp. NPDC049633 TaxID=3154355 RepID=UPI00342738DB